MWTTATIFLFPVVSLLLLTKRHLRNVSNRNKNLPPGPVGIPLLGYLPFLNVFNLGESFDKLSRKFGSGKKPNLLYSRYGVALRSLLHGIQYMSIEVK